MTTKNQLLVIALLLLVLVMVIIGPILSNDLAWCIDNYSPDRVIHCLWYENGITGRFIQPSGF